MKILKIYQSRIEAEVVHSKLEAYGIHAIVESDDMAGLQPGMTLVAGVKILVEEKGD